MTTTTETTRIRWEDDGQNGYTGYAGNWGWRLFDIWQTPSDFGEVTIGEWVLATTLPGRFSRNRSHGKDPGALKAEAERWLAGFVSSLGAAFPEEPGESAAFQLGEARAVLARWDAEQGGEFVISREKVLADQVRALLAIVDQEAAVKAGED